VPSEHSSPSKPLVHAHALGKTYVTPSGSLEALHAVDAKIARGGITALVGASGSGKSTFLRAIAGLDRPSAGELTVDDLELRTASAAELRRHRATTATYVGQKAADNFIPHLTLAQHAHDSPGEATTLLERVGLAQRLGSRPAQLSGGEQARAAFALALARNTSLVVIDEPTAELDRDSAAPLLEAIRAHAHDGAAFIIATHDPDVTAIADTVLRLDRGRVVPAGDTPILSRAGDKHEPEGDVVLETDALEKSFRRGAARIEAVRGLSLQLRRGELGILLGRSGSGKSTVLTLLAGWQQPDGGTIRPHPSDPPWAWLGYLPQRFGLLPELTVRENVHLPARLSDRSQELEGRATELLQQLGLEELSDRRPHETSIGQQQRTALARALLLRPQLILADEPTSHQDAGWRDAIWNLLQEAATAGTTFLIATHETQAVALGTRVWQIESGLIP